MTDSIFHRPLGCLSATLAVLCHPFLHGQDAEAVPELEEVEVRAATPILESVELTELADRVSRVSAEQIEAMHAGDLSAALRRIPGVTISRYNVVGAFGGSDGGAVFIRGHGSGRPGGEIATLVDGVPRFTGVWTHPLLDTLSIDVAGEIAVYKSPQPVRLGTMAFGAVDIIPKRAPVEGLTGRAMTSFGSWDTWTARAEAAYRDDTIDAMVIGSHRESDGHRPEADGRVDAIYANLGFRPTEAWDLSLQVHVTDSRADDPGSTLETPPPPVANITPRFETRSTFLLGKAVYNHSPAGQTEIRVYHENGQMDWRQRHVPPPPPFPAQQLNTITDYENNGVRVRDTRDLDFGRLILGVDYDLYGGGVREVFARGPVRTFDEIEFRNTAGYAAIEAALPGREDLSLSAGLRYNDARFFDAEWGAQAGLQWQLENALIFVNTARSFNYPGVYVSVFGRRPPPWGVGDDWRELDAEIIEHVEIGADFALSQHLTLHASLFRDAIDNALRITPPAGPGAPGVITNIGGYRVSGAEAMLRLTRPEGFEVFAGGTFLDPSSDRVPNVPKWSLTAGASWQLTEALVLSGDYQFVDEQAVLNPRFPGMPDRVAAFHLVNARIAWTQDLGERFNATWFLLGENLLDEDYAYRPGYPMPGASITGGVDLTF